MVLGARGQVVVRESVDAVRHDGHEVPAGPRLRHEPALDGLRGLAVAVVVVFHLGHLSGGFLGVDLFFVLSGFLITSLLLAEHAGRSSIALGRFWARRARRLVPALVLVLLGVALLIGTVTSAGERPKFRGDALAAIGYAANWHALVDEADYWDMFTQPSPLDHMWSLAIEEQFYVIWPLVVVGLLGLASRRRRAGPTVIAACALSGAAASFLVLAATYSPLDTNRAYYGTDARAGPTLLGAALAALSVDRMRMHAGRSDETAPTGSWRSLVLAGAALAIMGWTLTAVDGIGPGYYRGGLVVFSLAAVVLVFVVTSDGAGVVGRALSVRPLVALGVISYGVYLWHWPVIVYMTPERTRVGGWVLAAGRIAVTLLVAVASYVVVERPIRRGALRGRTVRVTLIGSVVATCAAVVVVTAGVARVPGTDMAMGSPGGSSLSVYPDSIPDGAERILLVGDSGPTFLGPALAAEAERSGAVAASDSQPWCTVLVPEGTTRRADGVVSTTDPCHDARREAWAALVERFDPDVVIYYIAAGGGAVDLRLDGEWVGECVPNYARYLEDALREDLDLLAAHGASVALATTPRAPAVVYGPDEAAALACRGQTFEAIAADRPGTAIVDMAGVVQREIDEQGTAMFRDPVHLSDDGATVVARWLVPTSRGLIVG